MSAPGGVVATTAGLVQGAQLDAVWSFKAIPYAGPADGPQRFGAPAPPRAWEGVRPAAEFGPVVPQRPMRGLVASMLPMNPRQSLDALHLNVWTPDPSAGGLPVLVWIHGGGFRSGSGSDELYDGAAFARAGIVTVSLNYRLGAEGFAHLGDHAPDPSVAGGMGLADQVAALRWVRDNIAAFGGDPDRVTIAGESAGAMSVATLLAVPSARGLFRRAICQSGGADKVHPVADAERIGRRLLEKLGIAGVEVGTLAGLSPEDLLVAQDAMAAELASGELGETYGRPARLATIAFLPTYGTDLLPIEPLVALAAEGTDVDLLIGDNQDETEVFLAGVPDDLVATMGAAKLADWVGADRVEQVLGRVGAAYPELDERGRWVWLESERQFGHPVRQLAQVHAAGAGTTYRYRFAWRSDLHPQLGAHHVIELPFVFDTAATEQAQAIVRNPPVELTAAVRRAWTAFVRGEAPVLPGGREWPAYTAAEPSVARFEGSGVNVVPDQDVLALDGPVPTALRVAP